MRNFSGTLAIALFGLIGIGVAKETVETGDAILTGCKNMISQAKTDTIIATISHHETLAQVTADGQELRSDVIVTNKGLFNIAANGQVWADALKDGKTYALTLTGFGIFGKKTVAGAKLIGK